MRSRSACTSLRFLRVYAPSRRFSSVVRLAKVPRPSGTWATPRRTTSSVARRSMRSPAKRISPSVFTMAHKARSVVVLPAPFAPRSAVMRPFSSAKSRPCSTRVWPYPARSARTSSSAKVRSHELGMALDLGRRPLRDHLAEIQRDDLLGDAHDQAHMVLDEEHRKPQPLAQRPDKARKLADFLVVEAAR